MLFRSAARAGLKVTLVQDRPVLGGNASSEVRLWILGATSHMGNNNRWAREGGVIDEILVENVFRNPEGNPLLVDALLLEKVAAEPNITLLLNTAVHEVVPGPDGAIAAVRGFLSRLKAGEDARALSSEGMPWSEFNTFIGADEQMALSEQYAS